MFYSPKGYNPNSKPKALYSSNSNNKNNNHDAYSATTTAVPPSFTAPPTRNPIVVSSKAEALSHSETTMKLTPSYDLFQILPEDEGGQRSHSALLYEYKHQIMEPTNPKYDLRSKGQMEQLPEPFKLVEGELQPFSDSIAELVSSDQPILSMAAKVRATTSLPPSPIHCLHHALRSTSSKSATASASAPPSSSSWPRP